MGYKWSGGKGECLARPRVIRGTQAKPLPLLPSGPGGVYSRPLHEARSLTNHNLSIRLHLCEPRTACSFSASRVLGIGLGWRVSGRGAVACCGAAGTGCGDALTGCEKSSASGGALTGCGTAATAAGIAV